MDSKYMNFYLILAIYILVINIISFFTMKIDKNLSIQNKRRVSEKTLFTLALVLGATGIYAGMYSFRHKTKHLKFTILIPIVIILNVLTIFFINYLMSNLY